MADRAQVHTDRLLAESKAIRDRRVRNFVASGPVTAVVVLAGVSVYAAFVSFGIDWARAAGTSAWEAAVWPIAATATTTQAFFCWLRFTPGWHANWTRWLFAAVASVGYFLAVLGCGLRLRGPVDHLHPSVATLVSAVPGLCMVLSVSMAFTFALAVGKPQLSSPVPGTYGSPLTPPAQPGQSTDSGPSSLG